ncbi:RHS repeat-associated core domain-containing protein [Nitrincola iocasae]|uniref:Type IV secretion protein Rhs n=1 Tax=Nitrincola iocasae TaxID=2614693 RepID=A0A5J6LB17_9GAMM|nr:RHS repeat-associated core domain-containing protein [Nitrincola iocasae]QEW05727.1 hypothetical protein F5I99_04065 [Nitrincola iocasae]
MGKPSARLGDNHSCPAVTGKTPHVGGPISSGSSDVFIGNQPAGRVGDSLVCNGPPDTLVSGSATVFINGRPAARMTDSTAHGGVIIGGLGSVLIGDGAAASSGEGEADQIAPCSPNCGNPVNPILGSKLLPATTDFALPAPAPFVFSRGYVSSNANIGILGQGWSVTGNNLRLTLQPIETPESNGTDATDALAEFDDFALEHSTEVTNQPVNQLILHDAHGRRIRFSELAPGAVVYSDSEQFWLARGGVQDLSDQQPTQSTNSHPSQHPAFNGLPESETLDENLYFVSTGQRVYLLKPCALDWQLAAEYTQQGYGTTYERDAAGLIQQVIDSAGRRYQFHYQVAANPEPDDPKVRLNAVDVDGEAACQLVQFDYNATGDLIAVRDRTHRIVIEYQWTQHILTGYTQPGRRTMHYEWTEHTPQGKVLKQIEEDGLTRTYDYQDTFTRVTDNLGREERYAFTGSGPNLRWSAHHRADGSEIHYSYNKQGQRLSEIDPLGGVTSYQRDGYGQLIYVSLPDKQHYRYQRDANGRLTQTQAPDGATHQFQYDDQGNISAITDALQHTSQIEYDYPSLPDRPTRRIDPEGATHHYTWTDLGQLASVTDCSDQTTQYEYDVWGQLIRVTDPLEQITCFEYNAVGQRTAVILPDRSQLHYTYNNEGLLSEARDAKGVIQSLRYDAKGQVIAETDANNHTRRYRYDLAGRPIEITNANGATYAFEYDTLDRVVREVGFDGRERHYTYNLRGDLIQQQEVVNGETQSTTLHYDALGRLLARELPATEMAPEQVEHFRYDAVGRLVQADNIYARVEWTYDPSGALLIEQQWHKNAHLALQRAEVEPPECDQFLPPIPVKEVVWEWHNQTEYNSQGLPTLTQQGEHPMGWLTYGSGHLLALRLGTLEFSIEPDALHREQTRQIQVRDQAQPLLTRERRYNPVGLLAAQRDIYISGEQHLSDQSHPIQIHQYRYDARFRLTGLTQSIPTSEPNTPLITQVAQTFEYDPAGRLTGSALQSPTGNHEHHYALDPEGNRINGLPSSQSTWSTNRIDQYQRAEYRYDNAGNLIEKRTPYDLQSFEYDGLQRLSSVTRQRPGYPTTKTYYVYDALSRRIAKQVFPERCPSQLTRYGWDGDQLVHEDTGEQRTTVFYEPSSFAPLFRVDELGIDALEASGLTLEQFNDHNINTPRYSAFITNHLGTPTKLIDEDGHLLWSAEPDDWAAIKNERTVPNLQQPIRFQGQWLDEETGLYYNRYRYYDPKQGRYITQDPIGLAGGLNSYAYVANPTGWVDPLGLHPLLSGLARVATRIRQASTAITVTQAQQANDIGNAISNARALPQCIYHDKIMPSQIPPIEEHFREIADQTRQTKIEGCESDRRNQLQSGARYSLEDIQANYNLCIMDAERDIGEQIAADATRVKDIVADQQKRTRELCLPGVPNP